MAFAGLALFVSIGVVLVRVKRLTNRYDNGANIPLRASLLDGLNMPADDGQGQNRRNDCCIVFALLYVAGSAATVVAFANDSPDTGRIWDVVCISVTVGTSFLVPGIVRWFQSMLETHDVDVPDGSDAVGWFGLLMFMHGVTDLFADINLCVTLFCLARYRLACSALGTLLLSTATTWFRAGNSLRRIQRDNPAARAWYIANGSGATFVILMSCCRIESMAILRLRLCGRSIVDFPMDAKHFHFLRYSGWFHAILADIPHLLVCTALLMDVSDRTGGCDGDFCKSWLLLSPQESAAASIVFSVGSIVWGFVSRAGQLLVADPSGRRSQPSGEGSNPYVEDIRWREPMLQHQQQMVSRWPEPEQRRHTRGSE